MWRCTQCGNLNENGRFKCTVCRAMNPSFISQTFSDIDTLRDQFKDFCSNPINIQQWGERAIIDSQITVIHLMANVEALNRIVQSSSQPVQTLANFASSNQMTSLQWIAYFICLRQIFKSQVGKRKGHSGHLDIIVKTRIGTFSVRNSYDDKGTGTTRMSLSSTTGDILDPSYSVIRQILNSIGNPRLIALLLSRFSLGQTLSKEEEILLNREITLDIGNKNLFKDLAKPSEGLFSFFEKPKKVSSHQYSAFESIASKGTQRIKIRIGDFFAFLWGLFFIAEGRHAAIVMHYNHILLQLISEGHLSFEACLENFSYQKDKIKHLFEYSGSLFPSSNFAPYGYKYKTPHKKRYEVINTMSRYNPYGGNSLTSERIERMIGESINHFRALLQQISNEEHSEIILFVLYKIAFIEYLRYRVFPKKPALSFYQPKTSSPPQNLPDLQKILALLGELTKRLQSSSGHSLPANTNTGNWSQYGIHGAESACSPIAVMAISALLQQGRILSTTEINNLVVTGGGVYQGIVGGIQCVQAYCSKQPSGLFRGVHLNPYEIPQEVFNTYNLVWGGQVTCWRAGLQGQLDAIFSDGINRGVAIVIGGYTVSVTHVNGKYYVFDSHGFRQIRNAFVQQFNDLNGVVELLIEMITYRNSTGQISISIFNSR